MLKVKGGKSIDEKDFYVKWNTDLGISEDAARITKYNPKDMEKKGVEPEGILPTVIDWLDNADYIIGHNILGFDLYLIKDFYQYANKDYKHLVSKIIDTNCIARGNKGGMPYDGKMDFIIYQYKVYNTRFKKVKSNLTWLGKEYDIEHDYDNLHNAIVDLKLNLKVWNKLKWQVEI
tara:strand:- start:153 stop:680 length:528 start_codon:yes stop_codon:yes gene_type:complete